MSAARYLLMNTEGQDTGLGNEPVALSLADRWIGSRLQQAERAVNEAIQTYRFDLAAQTLYEFTWNEYCDWYLELSKFVGCRENHDWLCTERIFIHRGAEVNRHDCWGEERTPTFSSWGLTLGFVPHPNGHVI